MFQSRRRAWGTVPVLLAALVVLVPAGPAWAHNQVVDTAPGDGTTVAEPVGAVVLRVDHPPREPLATSSSIEVVAPGGDTVSGEISADPPQRLAEPIPVLVQEDGEWVQDYHFEAYPLRVPLAALPEEGEYTVTYSVADSDGHPTEGSFTFTYAGATGPVPDGAPDPEAGPTLVTTASAEEAAAAGATPERDTPERDTPDGEASVAAGAEGAEPGAGASEDAAAAPVSAEEEEGGASGPLLAGAAGLAVLGAGAGYLWRRRRAPTARPAPDRRRQRASARPAASRRSPSAKRPR